MPQPQLQVATSPEQQGKEKSPCSWACVGQEPRQGISRYRRESVQLGAGCSCRPVSAHDFYGLFKLLFPSFNPPYVQILTLTTLRFTNHTTQEQQDNSFYCKSEYRLATAITGGRGGVTQQANWEFFESF